MLSLTPWRERLEALPASVSIDMAADIEAAQATRRVPGQLLVPGRDKVSHAGLHPHTRHRVVSEVLLVSAVPRRNRPLGDSADDPLTALREPVLGSLINWMPPGCDVAVKWNGGQLLGLASHALFWVDVLTTEYWWRTT